MSHEKILRKCPLFEGISARELPAMLECLTAKVKQYGRDEAIFSAGSAIYHVGVVLSGSVLVQQDDYWGNRAILAHLGPGDLFAEAFSCAGVRRLPVGVLAADPSEVMLIDTRKITTTCPASCVFHARLIQNMVQILAQKNVALTQKMETIAQRSTRDKLLVYLSQQARRQGQNAFDIPFNRQELADYLSVDRSAMSSALSKMQKEGLLRFNRNHFQLLSSC